MRRHLTEVIAALLCIFIFLAGGKSVAHAEADPGVDTFSGNVELLKKDGSNYVMQVTAENSGEDFTGTVQLIFACYGSDNCAYNTEITLPDQGRKQFTVTVPERAVETVRGLCAMNFLDEKGRLLQSIQLENVFGNAMSGITAGILSDNYSGLTFMDAGGKDFMVQGTSCPLKLLALDKNNLKGYLDGLYFLIIDQFNVSTLSDEDILAVQDWVMDGGWLMIGTGPYAEWTLSGFEKDFQDVDILGVTERGEENFLSVGVEYGSYYNYRDAGIDFTQMQVADLEYDSMYGVYYESSQNPAICSNVGDGAVMIFPFSLGEEELQKLDDYVIQDMYEELMVNSISFQSYNGSSDMEYVGKRAFALIDSGNTDIDFTWLELLIGFYVILIGPVLYLTLRKCKKSEWYWVGVPVSGLAFIAGVFFFGQGIRVDETRVYSITVQQADSSQEETYFLAYHSGVKPWNMLLEDSYEVAGPGWSGYYRYNLNTNDYMYMVSEDSEGMWVGVKPRENFESGYLYACGKADRKGTITGADVRNVDISGNISGAITNGTGYDMAYMALCVDSYIIVFSDVKAEETLDLQQAVQDGRCVYRNSFSYFENLLYNMLSFYGYRSNLAYDQNDMAALLIGLGAAEEAKPRDAEGDVLVIGVVRDYEKAVVNKCKEISYGCIYAYIETEAEEDAPN